MNQGQQNTPSRSRKGNIINDLRTDTYAIMNHNWRFFVKMDPVNQR